MNVSMRARSRARRRVPALIPAVLVLLSCGETAQGQPADETPVVLYGPAGTPIPSAPAVPDGAVSAEVTEGLEALFDRTVPGGPIEAIDRLGAAGDPRVLWLLTDLFPFSNRDMLTAVRAAFVALTETELAPEDDGRLTMINRLIAWDLPAFPGYREYKWRLFRFIEPLWEPFFTDEDSIIDWRLVGWGGVAIDERLHATPEARCLRGCIPAIDDPAVTSASGGDWYPTSGWCSAWSSTARRAPTRRT